MKGALAVVGVIVVAAATYFIAKGKSKPPTTSGKQSAGSVGKQIQTQLASKLITSENISAAGGLLKSILPQGGVAKVAPTPGNGSGFVTEKDLGLTALPPSPSPAPVASMDNSFVTDLEDDA